MNNFQKCRNTSDAVPLYLPQKLYLKPIARMCITVHLPINKCTDKSISNWEIMEKLRGLLAPEEFSILKVSKSTLEFIRFDAEIEDKNKVERTLTKLNDKTIKLNGFLDLAKVKVCEAKSDFPNRHAWDSFFRDAKDMDEMKPGERPDTIHFSNLPTKWFVPPQMEDADSVKPSEKIFRRIFEKFGSIRHVDIPICDPYRNKMKPHMSGMQTFTFDQHEVFEAYIQFKDYIGFSRTMDAFRGMKLLRKETDGALTVSVSVDFDKTKHLSDSLVRRRQIIRDRLAVHAREKEMKEMKEKEAEEHKKQAERQNQIDMKLEKEMRQHKREERRKNKQLAKLKVKETDEFNEKIAKEEKKLLKVQVKLEAIRLLEELFTRIKNKKELDAMNKRHSKKRVDNELTKFKENSEHDLKLQKEKLHKVLEGRIVLKSILSSTSRNSDPDTDSDSDSNRSRKKAKKKKKRKSDNSSDESESDDEEIKFSPENPNDYKIVDPWYSYRNHNEMYPYGPMYAPPHMSGPPGMYPFPPRGGRFRGGPGPSRSAYPRRRGGFNARWQRGGARGRGIFYNNPDLHHEYVRYFEKFLEHTHDDRNRRSYSKSRSRSRSRRRSKSRSRSRRRSYSRTRRSRSKSFSHRSRSRSRSKSRRSKGRSRSRSMDKEQRRSRSRSRSRRGSRSPRSRSRDNNRKDSRSPSYKSIDSSTFISPSKLRTGRSRSKSWSLPKETDKKDDSWSKTPSLKSD